MPYTDKQIMQQGCPHCTYSTNRSFNLRRHIDQSHPHVADIDVETVEEPSKQTFPCPTCYKSFCRKTLLNRHLPHCTKVQSVLQCPYCFKTCSSSGSLCNHKKTCKSKPTPFYTGDWISVPDYTVEACMKCIRNDGIPLYIRSILNQKDYMGAFRKVEHKRNIWEVYEDETMGWQLIEAFKLAEHLFTFALSIFQKAYDESDIKQRDIQTNVPEEYRIEAFLEKIKNNTQCLSRKMVMKNILSILNECDDVKLVRNPYVELSR